MISLVHFQLCVAARLCQSLIMGMYTHTLDPENDYILSSQKNGWELLQQVWQHENIEKLWMDTENEYLTRSEK